MFIICSYESNIHNSNTYILNVNYDSFTHELLHYDAYDETDVDVVGFWVMHTNDGIIVVEKDDEIVWSQLRLHSMFRYVAQHEYSLNYAELWDT
jgi:tRNA A37 threonylcarbamoyladenosine biosynthesis protein TsaE